MKSGKQIARDIFRNTLAALDIPRVMQQKLSFDQGCLRLESGHIALPEQTPVFVVAIGKASHAMVAGLRQLLPGCCAFRGVVAAPTRPQTSLPGLQYFVGGHPDPNEGSWQAAEAILELIRSCDEHSV